MQNFKNMLRMHAIELQFETLGVFSPLALSSERRQLIYIVTTVRVWGLGFKV